MVLQASLLKDIAVTPDMAKQPEEAWTGNCGMHDRGVIKYIF